jgi:hypothetical protein
MNFPSWVNWHFVAQSLATVTQILNLAGKVAPPKYEPLVLISLSFAQWAMGTIALYQQPPTRQA